MVVSQDQPIWQLKISETNRDHSNLIMMILWLVHCGQILCQNKECQNLQEALESFFGPDITQRFLENNDLKCIVRSHTEIRSGCTISHTGCYTVFSAPNREKGILGGVLVVQALDDLQIKGNVFPECNKEEALFLMEDPTFSSLLPLSESLKQLEISKAQPSETEGCDKHSN